MHRLTFVLALCVVSCASVPLQQASAPPDWSAVSDEETIEVVTRDPDGDVRETTIWLVVVDGVGTIRTGNTRWFANLQRDPNLKLRVAGAEYPMRIEMITDPEQRARVAEAFRAKYGIQDRTVLLFRGAGLNEMRLLPPGPR